MPVGVFKRPWATGLVILLAFVMGTPLEGLIIGELYAQKSYEC
jgi:hypothetical protein